MVKVKRIVHLQDKNIAEDDAGSQVKADEDSEKKGDASVPERATAGETASPTEGKEDEGQEERR